MHSGSVTVIIVSNFIRSGQLSHYQSRHGNKTPHLHQLEKFHRHLKLMLFFQDTEGLIFQIIK